MFNRIDCAGDSAYSDGVMGDLAALFVNEICQRNRLYAPTPEYRFHSKRRWRFDWAWPEYMVALEVEGGVWIRGRHTRGGGFIADIEKYNEAAIAGWRVLRCTTEQFRTGVWVDWLRRALRPQLDGETNGVMESQAGMQQRRAGAVRRAKRRNGDA